MKTFTAFMLGICIGWLAWLIRIEMSVMTFRSEIDAHESRQES